LAAAPIQPEIVGHKGAAAHAEGNTRASFQAAIALGVDRLECDVRRTADGVLVLFHDERIIGPDGRDRRIARLSVPELRELVPELLTLRELAELAGGVPLMIDVKGPGYADAVADVIRRFGLAGDSNVATTHAGTLRRLRAAFPRLELCLSTGHMAGSAPTALGRAAATAALRAVLPHLLVPAMAACGASAASLHRLVVTPAVVRAVQDSGRRVFLWTVDGEEDIARAIALRPDGIISNRPDAVRAALDRGRAPPRD
jgi:glycerophosphoryl diester phosphodiesterase